MHAQNRNTAASSPGGRGPPAASSECTGVPAAGAAAAAAAARILSQGRQRVPAGTASRLRPEAWSPWPLDPSCGVPSPTTTLTGALGENPVAAPRRLAPIRGGSLAQEANPGRRGRRPERALPFFFFSSSSARKRSLEATSPLPEADRGAFHWIPVWGNPKRETTRPEDGDAESRAGAIVRTPFLPPPSC